MDIVGCVLASEQPVRLHDSIAIGLWPGKLLNQLRRKGAKSCDWARMVEAIGYWPVTVSLNAPAKSIEQN